MGQFGTTCLLASGAATRLKDLRTSALKYPTHFHCMLCWKKTGVAVKKFNTKYLSSLVIMNHVLLCTLFGSIIYRSFDVDDLNFCYLSCLQIYLNPTCSINLNCDLTKNVWCFSRRKYACLDLPSDLTDMEFCSQCNTDWRRAWRYLWLCCTMFSS